jgi:hypothetical protein
MERPVASGRNVAERGRSQQFVQERIEKRQERLPGVLARFVHKSAEAACPDTRAPTGAANLNRFTLEDQEGARIRVRNRTDIGYEALCTGGNASARLPHRAREKAARTAAAPCPAGFGGNRSGCIETQGGPAYSDNGGVGSGILSLQWSCRAVSGGIGIRAGIPARHKHVDTGRCQMEKLGVFRGRAAAAFPSDLPV